MTFEQISRELCEKPDEKYEKGHFGGGGGGLLICVSEGSDSIKGLPRTELNSMMRTQCKDLAGAVSMRTALSLIAITTSVSLVSNSCVCVYMPYSSSLNRSMPLATEVFQHCIQHSSIISH